MRAETETRVRAWETRPTDDGYAGLHALIEAEFSGAITAGETWLFVLDGRPIGLFDGPIRAFANAPIAAYAAPHPALPLLFTMQERGGETTARYYTDDTPLADTAQTLASNGFTGYVELSENVLSGEYYLVFHRGRSIEVAFVGEGDRLLTDEEARTRADEEVGIYEVTAVTLEELDLPEPPESENPAGSIDPADADGPDRSDDPGESDDRVITESSGIDGPVEVGDPAEPKREPSGTAAEPTTGAEPSEGMESVGGTEPPRGTGSTGGAEPASGTKPPTGTERTTAATETDACVEADASTKPAANAERTAPGESTGRSLTPTDRWGSAVEEPVEDRLAAEQRWRETARIPSLEPDRTHAGISASGSETGDESGTANTPEPRGSTDELESERRLRETAEAEADRLREELASLRERLETLETADEADGSGTGIDPSQEGRTESIPSARALSETDLFVRYATASGPTLEAAHSGGADRTAVDGNLRLERHTGFDPTGVLVGGRPFAAFLEERIEHRFADWVVRSLPFDVRETGHRRGLERLYDAIPAIDRIDFDGVVDASEEDELTFDVVFRSRMGEPLIVADCVDSREAVGEKRVASLVTAANAARESEEKLVGAMLVTTSFFDPGALETAAEATRSGLLGRSARESYVTISRRCGYHLCLIEMRDAFHVRMPEL